MRYADTRLHLTTSSRALPRLSRNSSQRIAPSLDREEACTAIRLQHRHTKLLLTAASRHSRRLLHQLNGRGSAQAMRRHTERALDDSRRERGAARRINEATYGSRAIWTFRGYSLERGNGSSQGGREVARGWRVHVQVNEQM